MLFRSGVTDVKPDISVNTGSADNAIEEEPEHHPSIIYEPDLSPDPIITVKLQPFPSFGLDQDLSNLDVKLIDYGSGKDATTFLSWLFKLTKFTRATSRVQMTRGRRNSAHPSSRAGGDPQATMVNTS